MLTGCEVLPAALPGCCQEGHCHWSILKSASGIHNYQRSRPVLLLPTAWNILNWCEHIQVWFRTLVVRVCWKRKRLTCEYLSDEQYCSLCLASDWTLGSNVETDNLSVNDNRFWVEIVPFFEQNEQNCWSSCLSLHTLQLWTTYSMWVYNVNVPFRFCSVFIERFDRSTVTVLRTASERLHNVTISWAMEQSDTGETTLTFSIEFARWIVWKRSVLLSFRWTAGVYVFPPF